MSKEKKKRAAKKELQDKENLTLESDTQSEMAETAEESQMEASAGEAQEVDTTEVPNMEVVKEILESIPSYIPEPKPAQAPEPQQIVLQDAARRMVIGWKDHWFQGLAKFAKNKGFTGAGSQEECRKILQAWGAKLK